MGCGSVVGLIGADQSALKSIALNPNIDETSRRIAQGVLEHRKLFKVHPRCSTPSALIR